MSETAIDEDDIGNVELCGRPLIHRSFDPTPE
jgi:hypothetical protein